MICVFAANDYCFLCVDKKSDEEKTKKNINKRDLLKATRIAY